MHTLRGTSLGREVGAVVTVCSSQWRAVCTVIRGQNGVWGQFLFLPRTPFTFQQPVTLHLPCAMHYDRPWGHSSEPALLAQLVPVLLQHAQATSVARSPLY